MMTSETTERKRPKRRLRPSPCVGVCTGGDVGWCNGCGRTAGEIEAWQNANSATKRTIWTSLPKRLARLKKSSYRMAHEPDGILAFVATTLKERAGAWKLGIEGAGITFAANVNGTLDLTQSREAVHAATGDASLELHRHDSMRAFGLTFGDHDGALHAVVLTLPRSRLSLPVTDVLTRIGGSETENAVFDLGLGLATIRYSVRSADASTIARLTLLEGMSLDVDARQIQTELCSSKLVHIVETGLGRIEIPGDRCAVGADVETAGRLSEALRRQKRELPQGAEIPNVFAPCAVFFPTSPAWLQRSLPVA